MEQLKIILALVIAVALQVTLRSIAEPLAFIDFPLIVVVYAALQRNGIRALLFGTIAGIAVDALSGGLLGGNGFSKTLVAYVVLELARRVYLDNLLLRVPVIAGACLADHLIYYWMHVLLGQPPAAPLLQTIVYALISTTIAGTLTYIILEFFASDGTKTKKREVFTQRRQTRRRNPIRLNK